MQKGCGELLTMTQPQLSGLHGWVVTVNTLTLKGWEALDGAGFLSSTARKAGTGQGSPLLSCGTSAARMVVHAAAQPGALCLLSDLASCPMCAHRTGHYLILGISFAVCLAALSMGV